MGIRTLLLAVIWPAVAHADEPENAVAIFTTPLPQRSYVRLEPSYTFVSDGGSTSQLLLRGVVTYHGWVIPGLGPADADSGWRLDLTAERIATPRQHAIGIGKLGLTQLSGVMFGWGSFGAGIAMSLPTQTNSAFGDGDVQVGPSVFGYVSAIPDVPASLIASSLFATGSSPAVVTTLEPTISVELGETFSLLSNGEIEIDWFARDARVPVNLRLGYTVNDHLYVEAGPEVVVAGSSKGDVTLDAELDILL